MNKFLEKCRHWSENPLVLWSVFSLTLAASFYRGYGFSNNSYAIASWLVTYEAGFIKRGLVGSILQLEVISRISGLSIPTILFGITNFLLVLLHILALFIVMRMATLNKMALLLIPYFLIGPLLRTQSVWIGNIDHLLAIMMIAIVYCLIKENFFLAIILSAIGIFIHEIIFAMVFPVFSFWLLIQLVRKKEARSRHFNTMIAGILVNVLTLIFIILYHDNVSSGDYASFYIGDLLSRQPEDNYNSGAITEVYATTFWQWFLFQKGEFLGRIVDPGLFVIVVIPAFNFFLLFFLSSGKSRDDLCVFLGSLLLAFLPLSVLMIAWDIDRIWNLSIWVVFLILWFQLERKPFHVSQTKSAAIMLFFFSIPAFLIPQVRSNPEWSFIFIIYTPYIIWQFIFFAGLFYKKQ